MKPYSPKKLPLNDLDYNEFIEKLSEANRCLARYDGMLESIPNKYIFLSPIMTQEAVLSSKIEGTQATFQEVLEFEANKQKYQEKNATPVQFVIISPLADGADRIFTDAIWAAEPDAKLIVPLPFEKEEYESTFFDQDSIRDFNRYLEHPNCIEHYVIDEAESGIAAAGIYRYVGDDVTLSGQTLDFNLDSGSGPDYITRTSGNWADDGFSAGQKITITGA